MFVAFASLNLLCSGQEIQEPANLEIASPAPEDTTEIQEEPANVELAAPAPEDTAAEATEDDLYELALTVTLELEGWESAKDTLIQLIQAHPERYSHVMNEPWIMDHWITPDGELATPTDDPVRRRLGNELQETPEEMLAGRLRRRAGGSSDYVRVSQADTCEDAGLWQIETWDECQNAARALGKSIGRTGGSDDATTGGFRFNPRGCHMLNGQVWFNPKGLVGFAEGYEKVDGEGKVLWSWKNTCKNWAGWAGGHENGSCLCSAKSPWEVSGYAYKKDACVPGKNLVQYHDKSREECAALCDARADCLAFEYGVVYAPVSKSWTRWGDTQRYGAYARDCHLQSGNDITSPCACCNYDLFIKKKPDVPDWIALQSNLLGLPQDSTSEVVIVSTQTGRQASDTNVGLGRCTNAPEPTAQSPHLNNWGPGFEQDSVTGEWFMPLPATKGSCFGQCKPGDTFVEWIPLVGHFHGHNAAELCLHECRKHDKCRFFTTEQVPDHGWNYNGGFVWGGEDSIKIINWASQRRPIWKRQHGVKCFLHERCEYEQFDETKDEYIRHYTTYMMNPYCAWCDQRF